MDEMKSQARTSFFMFGSDVVIAVEPCLQTAMDFAEVSKGNDHYSKLQELEEDLLHRLEIM